jgi:hypothetical protein
MRLTPPIVITQPRPIIQKPRNLTRAPLPVLDRKIDPDIFTRIGPDPPASEAYADYRRVLTPEGGIRITYKDLELRLRQTIWCILAWSGFTGFEAWLLSEHTYYIGADRIKLAALLTLALINWLIVRKPVEVHRRLEIRPDCMIIDDADVFWLALMEGWPSFQPDEKEENQILCGTYGTRLVEFLTLRSFDELDRTPEVFAAHLEDAMNQLWGRR